MDFVDLKHQYQILKEQIDNNIQRVLNHGKFIMGPEVYELEEKLAEYVGVKHCVGVSSGTDALLIALMALDVGSGDEVIVPAFSFIATAEVVILLGAKPVFVDIDDKTYNIDCKLIEAAVTDKTKAIIPVSLFGQCVDFDELHSIADKHGIAVIEDGAQSFGATYKGRRSCGLSQIGCTSFFPSKPLGCYGDGGACFTDDDELASIMRQIRVHGQARRYHHVRLGINGRLDTIQAGVLLAKLEIFDTEIKLRQQIANKYSELLSEYSDNIRLPIIASYNTSVFGQYSVCSDNRDQLLKRLADLNVPTAVHYPEPMSDQPVFNSTGYYNNATNLSKQVFSLPMHPYLNNDDLALVKMALNSL